MVISKIITCYLFMQHVFLEQRPLLLTDSFCDGGIEGESELGKGVDR